MKDANSKSAKGAAKPSGDMRKQTGAGPGLAAHSKDAKSGAKSGQNSAASKKAGK